MNASSPARRPLVRSEWIRRCASRIRSLDDVVTLIDAADLATTLCDLPCCRGLTPDEAAARLFQDNLTPSQWNNDLSTLCGPGCKDEGRPLAPATAPAPTASIEPPPA